ncbi:MAG TPA: hypothetical protein VMZ28_25175 [Kofleriaceae bacterium]|nr:hypothetical protein [Kofleriaceae bacterium]
MRAGIFSVALLAAGCGGGAVDGGGGAGGPDAGPTRCEVNADCDDDDECTTDVCDPTSGVCGVSEIDPCAETTMMIEDDFESRAGALVEDETVFEPTVGGWEAAPGPSCPVALDVVLEDDFDGYGKASAYTHGAGGWTIKQDAGGAVRLKADPDDAANFAVEVMGTTTTGSYAQASHDLAPQVKGHLELRFRPPGKTKAKWITLDESTGTRFYLYFDNDGQMKYSNAGTKVNLGPYPEDVWMDLRMEWDADSDRVDLTVDGESYPDLPVHAPIVRHIDQIRARTATGTGLSFMIDDVQASGGDEVFEGVGASLRVGAYEGVCEEAASALRAFPSAQAGTVVFDLLARGGATVELVGEGQTRMALSLAADGAVHWSQGGIEVPVAGAAWTPDDWMRVMLRWDAREGSADLWVDDMDSAAAAALPMETAGALDGMRAAVSAGGVLWLDNLRVSASP